MDVDQFNEVLEAQIERSTSVLLKKAEEYATADRLHNFAVAAKLRGVSKKEALSGMMSKHTVSIYDMCESTDLYTEEQWNEKITDHINYLLLLRAVIQEDELDILAKGEDAALAAETYPIKDVSFPNRDRGEAVLHMLQTLINDYGQASLSDLYRLCGMRDTLEDTKRGWTNLEFATVSSTTTEGRYTLFLPTPDLLPEKVVLLEK